MRKLRNSLIGVILGLTVIFVVVLFIIRIQTYGPLEDNLQLLEHDHVEDIGSALLVHPNEVHATIVFYPGGFVEPESYLTLAHALSREGFRVIIVRMPINLAILGQNRANDYDEFIEGPLILAGHSLGGASAAFYVDRYQDNVDGLVFMAAYPAASIDFKELNIPVLSIQASHDEVLNQEAFEASRENLPLQTMFVMIDGGNHAGFGSYGPQRGDGEATLSKEAQHQLIVEALVTWFELFLGGAE